MGFPRHAHMFTLKSVVLLLGLFLLLSGTIRSPLGPLEPETPHEPFINQTQVLIDARNYNETNDQGELPGGSRLCYAHPVPVAPLIFPLVDFPRLPTQTPDGSLVILSAFVAHHINSIICTVLHDKEAEQYIHNRDWNRR